jgi:hypothetical protein
MSSAVRASEAMGVSEFMISCDRIRAMSCHADSSLQLELALDVLQRDQPDRRARHHELRGRQDEVALDAVGTMRVTTRVDGRALRDVALERGAVARSAAPSWSPTRRAAGVRRC